jgi:hypothetical protein
MIDDVSSEVEIQDERTDEGPREVAPVRYVISSYGADYTVDGLVKRMREGSVYVPSLRFYFIAAIGMAA